MATKVTFESLMKDIADRKFAPMYLLMGEESYFIDRVTDALVSNVLTETEKDFNMQTFYGVDSDVGDIVSAARRFPMMSDYLLIVVKEAQELDQIELIDSYARNPLKSTVLVINYKHKSADRRRAYVKNIEKNGGVIFESKALYDNQVPGFIKRYYTAKRIRIDDKSAQMLTDFVGTDISKLVPQLEKLEIILPKDSRQVTPDLVERNIGVSKDYNNFELLKFIIKKDLPMSYRIIDYFEDNPRDNSPFALIAVLFNYFSNLLECYWLPVKSSQAVGNVVKSRSQFIIADYMEGLRNFTAMKVMNNISLLREFDTKLKGMGSVSASQGDLLRELVFKIMF